MNATVVIKKMYAIVRSDNRVVLKISFENEIMFHSGISPKMFDKKNQLLLYTIGIIYDNWSQNDYNLGGLLGLDYIDAKSNDATIETFEKYNKGELEIAYNIVSNKKRDSGYLESEFITAKASFVSGTEAERLYKETAKYGKIKYEYFDTND